MTSDALYTRMSTRSSSLLASELRRTEPEIAFRASAGHTHHTWAKTFFSRPELYVQPQSIAEVQKIVKLAARCRRRVVVVGSGHSPSELTCSSSWMVNLDGMAEVLGVDLEAKRMRLQAGMRLGQLVEASARFGLTMPVLGSIDEQSVAGAIATGTHGSSMFHGTLASNVVSLRIVLGDGRCVSASATERVELFRAALCSLGALGVIVEVEYQLRSDRRIEWVQTSMPLDEMLSNWEKDLWTQAEYTRIWWMPYTRRAIVWRANETDKPIREPQNNWYGGLVGYHIYKSLLTVAHFIPRLLPFIEWFVFGMQYGFDPSYQIDAVQQQADGLLMDCLFSQFVNEWALPFSRGPDTIRVIDAWIHQKPASEFLVPEYPASPHPPHPPVIKPAPKGLRVHAPIEVRIANSSSLSSPRPYLDQSWPTEPTLYLNATLYRPYGLDPPCHKPYYKAFETIASAFGGRPHWAKNFQTVTKADLGRMYGEDLIQWQKVRAESDPLGIFAGAWHRRLVIPDDEEPGDSQETVTLQSNPSSSKTLRPRLPCEETVSKKRRRWWSLDGGVMWYGKQLAQASSSAVSQTSSRDATPRAPRSVASSSESFEVWSRGEAEESAVLVEKNGE